IITFGDNTYGQLGTMKLPAGVHSRYGQNTSHVMTVEAGGDCNFATTARGKVYAWGSNRWGQLGSSLGHVMCEAPFHIP
ncbi:hypothetical protein Pmar_PMAR019839, partial [Perkinsus marinus ATCC 50983]